MKRRKVAKTVLLLICIIGMITGIFILSWGLNNGCPDWCKYWFAGLFLGGYLVAVVIDILIPNSQFNTPPYDNTDISDMD